MIDLNQLFMQRYLRKAINCYCSGCVGRTTLGTAHVSRVVGIAPPIRQHLGTAPRHINPHLGTAPQQVDLRNSRVVKPALGCFCLSCTPQGQLLGTAPQLIRFTDLEGEPWKESWRSDDSDLAGWCAIL